MSKDLKSCVVFFLLAITIMVLMGSTQSVYAQPGGGGNPCPFPPCNPDVPISGIEILLAAGGLLGAKRILGLNKKSKNH